MTRRMWRSVLAGVFVVTLGCADSIVKMLGPENGETVSTEDGVFRFRATELDNVTDRRVFTWNNPAPRALVKHRNFVHHGVVIILVRDANGALADSTYAEWELDVPTDEGTPGAWTIEFRFYGARGRVDTSIEPLFESVSRSLPPPAASSSSPHSSASRTAVRAAAPSAVRTVAPRLGVAI
jgi:hypothetical protein